MRKFLFITLFVILNFAFFIFNSTLAHPMPLAVQELYAEFTENTVKIRYELAMEPFLTDRIYPVIDKDNSGTINESEINNYSDELIKNYISGRLNNKDLKLKKTGHQVVDKEKIWSMSEPEHRIKIDYEVEAPKLLDTNSFLIENKKILVPDDPNGDLLSFAHNLDKISGSRIVNSEQDIKADRATFTLDFKLPISGTDQSQPEISNSSNNSVSLTQKISEFFNWTSSESKRLTTSIFANENAGFSFVLLSLVVAFIAGSLHAVTPGHGKSMMAAFLVGKKKSKLGDIMTLGLSITFAHTIVIFVLGFVLLQLKQTDKINILIPYFEKVSAVFLLIIAISLLLSAYKNYQNHKAGSYLGKGVQQKETDELKDLEKGKAKNKFELFMAGLGGGIVPCPDALALLILAVTLGKVGFGLILIFAFSLGLAAAIVIIGLLLVQGKNKMKLEERFGAKAEIFSPLLTGIFVLVYAIKFIF